MPSLADTDWLTEQAATRSASSIARELGVTADTVLRRMRLHRIEIRFRKGERRVVHPELDDAEWLANAYALQSAASIARELGVAPSTVIAALERHGISVRDRSSGQQFRAHPKLHDPRWLREQYASGRTGGDIACQLGVSLAAVHHAMARYGIEADGAWVRRDTTRLERPTRAQLQRIWEREQTIRGVSLEFEVSHNTAAIWLADVGIFVKETPAISKRNLIEAIEAGFSIAGIRKKYRVTDRTVHVELRRFGLVGSHRRRPKV